MTNLSAQALKQMIVRTWERFYELDHQDWDAEDHCYGRPEQDKWEQAAREIAPPEWVEFLRILAQGWSFYGGSDLERRR